MEPIAIRNHMAYEHFKPWLEAKHAIIHIKDDIGLSVVWAKGNRPEHGLYCGEGTYEIMLIRIPDINDPWDFLGLEEPLGWITVEELGQICEQIKELGVKGYMKS